MNDILEINNFKIEHVGDMPCVRWSEIESKMTADRFARFKKWIAGQTCMSIDNETAIYASDLNRFLRGWPVID